MRNGNNNKITNLNPFLENCCNKRSKQHKSKDPFCNEQRQGLYTTAEILKYNYNTKVLFLTVTFPQKSGLEEEWSHT